MFPLIFLMGVRSEVLDFIASRVAEICEIKVNDIFLKGKQQKGLNTGAFFVIGRFEDWAFL